MKYLIMLLTLCFLPLCYAEEFTIDKKINTDSLMQEIQTTTGLDLEGQDQIGYMNTSNNKIEIKLNSRELTPDEKAKIEIAIKKHNPKTEEQKKIEEKAKKDKAKQELKNLGISDETIKTILKEEELK